MGEWVIAAYRPRPGKENRLLDVVREHLPVLRREGLVTDNPPLVLRAGDGTILEIFEWKSQAAVDAAHGNPNVQALWGRFAEVSEYTTLESLAEAKQPFPHFERVELG